MKLIELREKSDDEKINEFAQLYLENLIIKKENERLNKIIEIKNDRIQQLMKRTRSARIEKAIEYIYENTDFQHDGDDYGYMEWVDLKTNTQDFVETLLDILKGDDKE